MTKSTWWVDYSWEYEYFDEDTQNWERWEDGDSGRFCCLKKDIKKAVKDHIENYELEGERYRNLKVTINDQYMTTPHEV